MPDDHINNDNARNKKPSITKTEELRTNKMGAMSTYEATDKEEGVASSWAQLLNEAASISDEDNARINETLNGSEELIEDTAKRFGKRIHSPSDNKDMVQACYESDHFMEITSEYLRDMVSVMLHHSQHLLSCNELKDEPGNPPAFIVGVEQITSALVVEAIRLLAEMAVFQTLRIPNELAAMRAKGTDKELGAEDTKFVEFMNEALGLVGHIGIDKALLRAMSNHAGSIDALVQGRLTELADSFKDFENYEFRYVPGDEVIGSKEERAKNAVN